MIVVTCQIKMIDVTAATEAAEAAADDVNLDVEIETLFIDFAANDVVHLVNIYVIALDYLLSLNTDVLECRCKPSTLQNIFAALNSFKFTGDLT